MAAPAAAAALRTAAAAGANGVKTVAVAACFSASAAAKAAALTVAAAALNRRPPVPLPPVTSTPWTLACPGQLDPPDLEEVGPRAFSQKPAGKRAGGAPLSQTSSPKLQSRTRASLMITAMESSKATGEGVKSKSPVSGTGAFNAAVDNGRSKKASLPQVQGSLETSTSVALALLAAPVGIPKTVAAKRKRKKKKKNIACGPPLPVPANDKPGNRNIAGAILANFAGPQKADASYGEPVATSKAIPAGNLDGMSNDVVETKVIRTKTITTWRPKEISSSTAKAQDEYRARPLRLSVGDGDQKEDAADNVMPNGTIGSVAPDGALAELSCRTKPATQEQHASRKATDVQPSILPLHSEPLPSQTASGPVDQAQTVSGAPAVPRPVGDPALHKPLGKFHPTPAQTNELSRERSRELSQKLRELVASMQPTPADHLRRKRFLAKVHAAFSRSFGSVFRARVFGSADTDLWLGSNSDVDLCLVPTKAGTLRQPHIFEVRNALLRGGFEVMETISRCSVPIVKFTDRETAISSDVNVNNVLGIRNTELIKTYMKFDPRVRPLLSLVKLFAKRRKINDPVCEVTPSSYCHVMMTLNYLQTRGSPILPCLQDCPDTERQTVELTIGDVRMGQRRIKRRKSTVLVEKFVDGTFLTDLTQVQLRAPGDPEVREESIADLLMGFFLHYGHAFDFVHEAVSVRLGRRVYKKELDFHRDVIAVEDPFLLWKNLTYTSRPATLALLLSEYRRAAGILANCADIGEAVATVFEPRVPLLTVTRIKRGRMSRVTRTSASEMMGRENPAAEHGYAAEATSEKKQSVDDASSVSEK